MSDDPYAGGTLRSESDAKKPDANLPPEGAMTLRKLFDHDRAKAMITPFLPKGVSYEEVYAETAHAVANNPDLLSCTPMSLIRAVGRAAQTGLIIGENVHLVPFKVNIGTKQNPVYETRCQKVTDYKGEIELIRKCGGAKNINAVCVFANEIKGLHGGKFSFEQGTEPRIIHHPIYDPRERGPMAGAYAVAQINAYHIKIVWMHITEIEVIRKKSKGWAHLEVCPLWYAKKTVIHQIAKELPKTPKLLAIVRHLETEESDEGVGEIERLPEVAAA